MGTRLGNPYPKPLTEITGGETIIKRATRLIHQETASPANIVVGFKSEMVIDHLPTERFVFNDKFDVTNTSKSLLLALQSIPKNNGALWFNGDVVFDEHLMSSLQHLIMEEQSFITVNNSSVSEEEVKYTLDDKGYIQELSKKIAPQRALGEAVGINYVSPRVKRLLMKALKECDSQDYFERGIEMIIGDNVGFVPFDISHIGMGAIEVDFQEDLAKANTILSSI